MSLPQHDNDIYRGDPPPQSSLLDTAPSIISFSSSSSSSASLPPASPLGAIAAKLELAISRWAKNVRGNSSTSDSSSSHSSSSLSSTKSQQTQRTRRTTGSLSSLRTLQSERAIATRISRMKALEASRRIPRQFSLYLAVSHEYPQNRSGVAVPENDHPVIVSTSLPLVLNQLDLATRKAASNHRLRQRHRNPSSTLDFSSFALQTADDNQSGSVRPPAPRGRKGKHRQSLVTLQSPPVIEKPMSKPQAWFLDVASPTWADLRAIGKLLHIHPLTLEDILQQDPREKLELFTNLGYYFISFRAIESRATKERLQHEAATSGNNWNLAEGSLGEANVYLTVFDHGVCCFHFTDISEHTDRIRNRMVFQEAVNMSSSDWIAYDILDSIVDSFFPLLENIEREAMAIDNTIFSGSLDEVILTEPPEPPKVASIGGLAKRLVPAETNTGSQLEEKYSDDKELKNEKSQHSPRPRFVAPRLTVSLVFHRMKRFIINTWKSWRTKIELPPIPSQSMLRRIGSTRKLVTSLVRLLSTKSDVLTAFRKRLMRLAALKSKSMTGRSNDELVIYAGDIQDRVLTLQHSLVYYERTLSDLNPTYLSYLRAEISITKNKADVHLLYLSTVTVGCAMHQIIIGVCSMNIHILTNVHAPGRPHFWFIGVTCMSIIVVTILLLFIRHWWKQAKQRRYSRLE